MRLSEPNWEGGAPQVYDYPEAPIREFLEFVRSGSMAWRYDLSAMTRRMNQLDAALAAARQDGTAPRVDRVPDPPIEIRAAPVASPAKRGPGRPRKPVPAAVA